VGGEYRYCQHHTVHPIPNYIFASFGSVSAWADTVFGWLKEWQPILSGLLVLVAACIFAASSIKAARILAKGNTRTKPRFSDKPYPDLRNRSGHVRARQNEQPIDIFQSLEQLRGFVRSALSALTPSEGATTEALGASHLSYERILRLRLEKSAMPQNASKTAHELLESLSQHIEELDLLLRKDASGSDISNVLIKVNTIARNLAAALAQPSSTQTPPDSPSSSRPR
jgi:hypothetical protein